MRPNTQNSPIRGKKKRMIVSGMLDIILKKKIKRKFSLINKIWKHNFYVVILYSYRHRFSFGLMNNKPCARGTHRARHLTVSLAASCLQNEKGEERRRKGTEEVKLT